MSDAFDPFDKLDAAMDAEAAHQRPAAPTAADFAPSPQEEDEYDRLIKGKLKTDAAVASEGMAQAAEVSPDTYAKNRALAKDLRMPILLGTEDPKHLRSQHLAEQTSAFIEQHPILHEFLLNPDTQRLTHDDLPALKTLATSMRALKASEKNKGFFEHLFSLGDLVPATFSKQIATTNMALHETGNATGNVGVLLGPAMGNKYAMKAMIDVIIDKAKGRMPPDEQIKFAELEGTHSQLAYIDNDFQRLSGGLEKVAEAREGADTAAAELTRIQEEGPSEGLAYWLVTPTAATINMAPSIAAFLVNPILGSSVIYTQVFGDSYYEARTRSQRQLDPGGALLEATFKSVIETASELVPLGQLAKPAKNVLVDVLRQMGLEGGQEMFVEIIDIIYDIGFIGKDVTLDEAISRVFESGAVGAIVGGQMAGVVKGTSALLQRTVPNKRAEEFANSLTEAQKAVEATKLSERAPDQMREALEIMAPEGDAVFVPADKLTELMQDGILLDLSEESKEEILAAAARGGDVEIKASALLMLPKEEFIKLSPHIRETIRAPTSEEAGIALADRESNIATLLEAIEEQQAADPSTRVISDTIVAQMTAAGRSLAEANVSADIVEARYAERAATMEGVTAEQLFLEDNVGIRTEFGAAVAPVAPSPAVDPLQQTGDWQEATIEATTAAGEQVAVNAGEQYQEIQNRKEAAERLMECINAG